MIIIEKFIRKRPSYRCYISNEVHRKTDTLFSGNNTTAARLNHRPFDQEAQALTTKPRCLLKKRVPIKLGLVDGND